jgi:hypothetical protein
VLTEVAALTKRMNAGDITRSRADQARRAVQALIQAGGETAPRLRRERVPA